MKRLICLLLVFALCLPIVLSSCDVADLKGKQTEESDKDSTKESNTGSTKEPVNDDTTDDDHDDIKDDGDDDVKDDEDDDVKDDDIEDEENNSSDDKPTTDPQDKPNNNNQNNKPNDDNQNDDGQNNNNQNDNNQNGGNQGNDNGNQTPADTNVDLPAGAQVKKTYTLEKKFMTDSVSSQMKTYIESGKGTVYSTGAAPFVLKGALGFGNAKLTSITIPVRATGTADSDGNFIFTLAVYNKISSVETAKTAQPNHTYKIKISGAVYGLEANQKTINKVITVDLRGYDIYLESTETLGFSCNSGETLLPVYFHNGTANDEEAKNWLVNQCGVMKGFYACVGSDSATENGGHVLYYDFTYENTYESEAEYELAVRAEFTRNGGKYTLNAPYMSEQTHEMVKDRVVQKELSAGKYNLDGAPYAPQNPGENIGLSGTRLTSITIPVMATGKADANGNYIFTISICNKSDLTAAISADKVKKILISKKIYGLEDSQTNIYKFITVDLSAYDIVIGDNETVAFSASEDTLLPIYIGNSTEWSKVGIYQYLAADPVMGSWKGFVKSVGRTVDENYRYDRSNIIFFDFTYAKEYTSADAYLAAASCNVKEELYWENFDQMLQEVKNAYENKNLSIMGDSISTYDGKTVTGNAVWYGSSAIAQAGFSSYLDTYWGNLIDHAGMNLLVDNAWSGDSVCYERSFGRAMNLGKDGVDPDLILMYFGINDTGNNKQVGELYDLLVENEKTGNKTRDQVVEEWLADALKTAQSKGFSVSENSTFTGSMCSSWSEGYALLLYSMVQRYSNSKIVLFELVENGAYWSNGYVNSNTLVPQYNKVISALADYFDLPVVRQYELIDHTNYEFYMHDCRLIHPNAAGHEVMFKELIYTLYNDLQKNK